MYLYGRCELISTVWYNFRYLSILEMFCPPRVYMEGDCDLLDVLPSRVPHFDVHDAITQGVGFSCRLFSAFPLSG